MPRFVVDIDVSKVKKLIEDNFSISVGIKRVECRVEDVKGEFVFRFNELIIVTKLLPCNL
jgi:hypothetical protein